MADAALDCLHEEVRALVEGRGWELTPIQKASAVELVAGADRILVAPTAARLEGTRRGLDGALDSLHHPAASAQPRYRQKAQESARTSGYECWIAPR